MVFYKRNYNNKRKRFNNRRKKRGVTKAKYSRSMNVGIPQNMMVKLSYADTAKVRGTTGQTLEMWTHRLNSCYDPDVAVGGTQPKWFDQYAAMYRSYVVYGAKVTITGCLDIAQTNPAFVCMVPARASALTFTHKDIMEKAGSRHTICVHERPFKLSQYYSIANIAGVPKDVVRNSADFRALVSSDPWQQLYIYTGCCSMNSTEGTGIEYDINIEYYVKFFDRKNVNDV